MVKSKDIVDINHIKLILDRLKSTNRYLNEFLNENDIEYERLCDKVVTQFCEIEEFIIGKERISEETLVNADIRIMSYWEYLDDKINFDELITNLSTYSR